MFPLKYKLKVSTSSLKSHGVTIHHDWCTLHLYHINNILHFRKTFETSRKKKQHESLKVLRTLNYKLMYILRWTMLWWTNKWKNKKTNTDKDDIRYAPWWRNYYLIVNPIPSNWKRKKTQRNEEKKLNSKMCALYKWIFDSWISKVQIKYLLHASINIYGVSTPKILPFCLPLSISTSA